MPHTILRAESGSPPLPRVLVTLGPLWLLWFAAYGVLGGLVGWTGWSVLVDTVDHVDSVWLQVTVLNVAGHLVLALVALLLAIAPSRFARSLVPGVAWLLTALILAHLGVSLSVAL
ncbi:MAG: hypothetical protein AAF628_37580 [Planctomycetota bacterium]